MNNFSRFILLPLLLITRIATAEPKTTRTQLHRDTLFAKELQKHLTCDTSEHAQDPTCTFSYLGTKIEIVNPASAALPNIFIHSVGKGQSILPRGARCVEIFFENKSLRTPGYPLNVGMLLHSTGKVWPSLDLELRKKCETE